MLQELFSSHSGVRRGGSSPGLRTALQHVDVEVASNAGPLTAAGPWSEAVEDDVVAGLGRRPEDVLGADVDDAQRPDVGQRQLDVDCDAGVGGKT